MLLFFARHHLLLISKTVDYKSKFTQAVVLRSRGNNLPPWGSDLPMRKKFYRQGKTKLGPNEEMLNQPEETEAESEESEEAEAESESEGSGEEVSEETEAEEEESEVEEEILEEEAVEEYSEEEASGEGDYAIG